MDAVKPTYEELEQRCRQAEEALAAIRNNAIDTNNRECGMMAMHRAETGEYERHLKQVLLAIRNVNQIIVHEHDRERLLNRACATLTETLGYHYAWIALMDGDKVSYIAASGLDDALTQLRKRLQRGEELPCVREALAYRKICVIPSDERTCMVCARYVAEGSATLAHPMIFGEQLYGVLVVSLPAAFAQDAQEQSLFIELASDLSFALHNIEAEGALRHQTEKVAAAMRLGNIAWWEMSLPDGTVTTDARKLEMLGRDPAEYQSVHYSTFTALLHPDDYAPAMQAMRDHLEGRVENYRVDYRIRHADGSWRWLHDCGRVAAWDAEGRPIRVAGVVIDISARKATEVELLDRKRLLDKIFDLLPVGLWFANREGKLQNVNPAGITIWGAEPLVGPDDYGIFKARRMPSGEEVKAEDWALMRSVRDGVTITDELLEIETFDGKRRIILNYTAPVFDDVGNICGAIVVNQDITDRKRAEDEAKREYALNVTIIDSIPGTFYMLDENGFYVRWNGYQRDEIVGKPDDLVSSTNALDTIHPDDRELIRQKITNVLANGVDETVEGRVLLHGGPAFKWLLMTGKRLIIDNRPFLLGIGIDITGRKRVEEEKEKLQVQLTQAQKMESVGRLAGGVAHDFNNMLGVIIGYAELAMMKLKETSPLWSDLDEIKRAAERSADLTRQLLAFARKQEVALRVVELNETIAGLLKMLQRLIGEDIRLAWHPTNSPCLLHIDPSQLDQILTNLCVNARDAIGGIGTLTIATRQADVDEAYCATHPEAVLGEHVVLLVRDTGCGMNAETLTHLFEPFFTTKGVGEGTGLGLSTVYCIVKQNNGFINVYSEPEQGTTFELYFPRYIDALAPIYTESQAFTQLYGTETILVVEDEPAILTLAIRILEQQGYTVLPARTPGEALQIVGSYHGTIDLILTDVIMPEMTGRQVVERVRSRYEDISIVFMSGYTDNVIAHHGVLNAGVHFLQKPFTLQDMLGKVREALDAARTT